MSETAEGLFRHIGGHLMLIGPEGITFADKGVLTDLIDQDMIEQAKLYYPGHYTVWLKHEYWNEK